MPAGRRTGTATFVGRAAGRLDQRVLGAVALLAFICGCALPASEPSLGEAPPDCRFPADTELAFAGQSTLAELGLDGDHPDRRARLYVTASRMTMSGSPMSRSSQSPVLRFAGASGSGVPGPLPEDWQPPP